MRLHPIYINNTNSKKISINKIMETCTYNFVGIGRGNFRYLYVLLFIIFIVFT